jgi:hypothetical protein
LRSDWALSSAPSASPQRWPCCIPVTSTLHGMGRPTRIEETQGLHRPPGFSVKPVIKQQR